MVDPTVIYDFQKVTVEGKVGTVIPMHNEIKIGTLKGLLKLARVDPDEFSKYI